MKHLIHFGVYPISGVYPSRGRPIAGLHLDGHNDPNIEHQVTLPDVMVGDGVTKCFVSGSWGCWGPADQATDGDASLHVVYESDSISATRLADLHAFTHYSLPDEDSAPFRVLDYALVSTEDWVETTHLATFAGHPRVMVFEQGKVTDTTDYDPTPEDDDE